MNDILAIVAFVIILVSLIYVISGFVKNTARVFSAKPKTANPSHRSWKDNKGIFCVVLMLVGLAIAIILQ